MQEMMENRLKFGLGGHLEWDPDTFFEDKMALVYEELAEIDSEAHIDYLDGIPVRMVMLNVPLNMAFRTLVFWIYL